MIVTTRKMAAMAEKGRDAAIGLGRLAARIDQEDSLPPEALGILWDRGFMTLTVPREFGGTGANELEAVIAMIELARGCGAAALLVALQALSASAIKEFGGKKAKDWFGKMVDRRAGFAFALSEPDPEPGKDVKVTVAKKSGTSFVIRGRKTFVTGARDADMVIVFAVTNPRSGLKKAISAFVLPMGSRGMMPDRETSRGGLRGAPAADLVFNGVKAPASAILGKRGQGYEISRSAIVRTAPLAAALSCGLLSRALDFSAETVRSRRGLATLSEREPLDLLLAGMSASLDASLSLTWNAARALSDNAPAAERLCREAKWFASEAAVKGIDDACRLIGAEAMARGTLLERLSRDARAAQLILGLNHIHRIEVARRIIRGK